MGWVIRAFFSESPELVPVVSEVALSPKIASISTTIPTLPTTHVVTTQVFASTTIPTTTVLLTTTTTVAPPTLVSRPSFSTPFKRPPTQPRIEQVGKPEAREAFQAMAEDYKQLIQFPPYSMLLRPNSHEFLKPYEFIPVKRPIDDDNIFSFDLTVSKFLLFHGDPIPVSLRIFSNTGEPIPFVTEIRLEILSNGQSVATIPLTPTEDGLERKVFSANYLPDPEVAENWATELTLKGIVQLAGYEQTGLTALFHYANPVAKLIGKGEEWMEGPHLNIPLKFSVQQEGRYKVSANLFAKETGRPIAHLIARGLLTAPQGEITLRAHASTLHHAEEPGPYQLRTIHLYRIPDQLGGERKHGMSPEETTLEIRSFDLETYSKEPYKNPVLQKKLELLQRLANPDDSESP